MFSENSNVKDIPFLEYYFSKYVKYKHGMNGKQSFPRKGSFREQLETQIRISN